MGRGELVALLDAAPGDLRTLTGTLRRWTHHGRMRTAFERANDARGGVGSVIVSLSVDPDTSPESTDTSSQVWYSAPNRWRVEGDDTTLYVSDGEQRWEGFTGLVTERSASGEVPTLADSPPLADWLLPGALLGAFRFGEPTEVEAVGRPCLAATAQRRAVGPGTMGVTTLLAAAGHGGDENQFVVDAEHGFVVRRTALLDGEPCSVTELTRLVVDEPIDPGRFRLPAGTTVQTLAEERARMLGDAGLDPAAVDLADHTAVSLALAAAHRRAQPGRGPLAERTRHFVPWGPPPDDEAAAQAAIRAAFRHYGEASADGKDLVNVQGGEGLVEPLGLAGRHLPGGAEPGDLAFALDAVRFVCPDEAVVWFSLEVRGEPSPLVRQRRGRAVRVGGRWLIERGTIAELLASAGVHVPPPP
jgi:hypothetical protein